MLSAMLDGSTDGEQALLLRKMAKRDTVTKLKALGELREALSAHGASWAAELMPHWVPHFVRLSGDGSWQVRESACAALGQLASLLGRQLAPHLRPLMAAWLCAKHDPHGGTAAAAAAAFGVAFPNPRKYADALLFCRDELARGLAERALSAPPAAASDKDEAAAADDAHARRVGSALRAASHLLAVAAESGEAPASGARAALEAALCGGEVWRLGSAASSFVRTGAYGWAGSVLSHSTAPAAGTAAEMAGLLLGGLKESEPACHAALWEPLLLLLRDHGAAVSCSAAARHTLPRLVSLLEHGCHGAAPTVARALLPLVSLLPAPLFEPPASAALPPAAALLAALWRGLGASALPPQHGAHLLRAYGELLQLLVVRTSARGAGAAPLLREALCGRAAAVVGGVPRSGTRLLLSPT